MSIPYECEGCGELLKIKDSLAGTKGRCPHCKFKFVVPMKGPDSGVGLKSPKDSAIQKSSKRVNGESLETPSEGELPATPPKKPAPAPSSPTTPTVPPSSATTPPAATVAEEPSSEKDDGENGFDLDAFLADDSAPNAKASAGLTAPPPSTPADTKPKYDKFGRRIFTAPTPPTGAAPASAAPPADVPPDATVVVSAGLPPKVRKPLINFDAAGSVKQLRKYAIHIVLGIALIAGAYWGADRMVRIRLPLPVLAEVSGVLKINGAPAPNLVVHLTPLNQPEPAAAKSGRELRLRDSTGVTDAEGKFRIQYMDGVYGAPMGRARVWLEPVTPADIKRIPPNYQTMASQDIRNVREVNDGVFNIDLKTQ
jgi:DNA-directed RNA polymerase subunit RPC12/RpoP